jgi:hypothetical protein
MEMRRGACHGVVSIKLSEELFGQLMEQAQRRWLSTSGLIRLAEINDSPLLLTTDPDFHTYRRHGRKTIPLVSP